MDTDNENIGDPNALETMAVRQKHDVPRSENSRIVRARQCLSGGGVLREDSDDELGYEDHPWEWVYDIAVPRDSGNANRPSEPTDSQLTSWDTRQSGGPAGGDGHAKKQIVGARMGSFECRIGDCVLLKAEGTNEAWVGLICEFFEEEGDEGKMANFMWFSSEREIRNKAKKRTDFMQVGDMAEGSHSKLPDEAENLK